MPLLELQGLDDDQVRRGFDALNQWSERQIFERWMPSGVALSGGAALARWRDMAAITLPAAGTPVITTGIGIPKLWVTGAVGLRVLYSGSLGTTNTINIFYNLDPVAVGEVPPTATLGSLTPPGPGTIDKLAVFDIAPTVAVTGAEIVVQLKIFRTSPDAYGGDVYIVGWWPLFYARKQ